MPSVTNTNNASICCGAWPDRHGITGNSYFDERTGREEYLETADLLLVPTPFQRAAKQGVKSALLSSKRKTTTLLSPGADVIVAAEMPSETWVKRLGPAPDRYTREINYWLMTAAIDLLTTRRDLGCLSSTPRITRCTRGRQRHRSRGNIWHGWINFSRKRRRQHRMQRSF